MSQEIINLIRAENWEVNSTDEHGIQVQAYGKTFPLAHPFSIYSKLYREELQPELKYTFLKRMHDMLWPKDIATWHSWTEERFRVYCEGWRIITWASGASGGKSVDAAKIILLDWLSSPKTNGAIIASTTINSLQARIYGYTLRYLREMAIPLPYTLMRSQPPKILYNRDDEIHCISALAAAKGTDKEAIKNYIGRHPKGKLILALDEAPDLDTCILGALPNLEAGKENSFQCLVIGNSSSKFDLHGALATPKEGWKSVTTKTKKWETTQNRGICLFFSCYDSPAIYESDPHKKALLSRFLITQDQIRSKEKEYGVNSEAFLRFVLGFWKQDSTDDTVLSETFINEYNVKHNADWSGMFPLAVVAGLDPAFSTGGDSCILRLAILGQDTSGKIVLDFRNEELLYDIKILANTDRSVELQISDRVIQILNQYNCNMGNMAVDCTGQGRAIGEVIKLRANSLQSPIKIWSSRTPTNKNEQKNQYDIVVKSSLELWTDVRDFIQTDQIRGLDLTAIRQLTSRLININPKTLKRVLESKADYKVRMGGISPLMAHSPDEADSVCLCVQAAKIKFGFAPGQRREVKQEKSFELEKWWVQMHTPTEEQTHGKQSPIANFSSDIYSIGSTDPFKPF